MIKWSILLKLPVLGAAMLAKLTLSWHQAKLLCSSAQQMVSAGIGTDTLCIIVIIVRGNLTLSLQKRNCRRRSKVTGLKNSEQNDQLTKLELRRGFILPSLARRYQLAQMDKRRMQLPSFIRAILIELPGCCAGMAPSPGHWQLAWTWVIIVKEALRLALTATHWQLEGPLAVAWKFY